MQGKSYEACLFFLMYIIIYLFILHYRATLAAYGFSLAWGPMRATAVSPCLSHSKAGSEPPLRPTP